jgi:AAA+ ATPase superfamily predicted ATPase
VVLVGQRRIGKSSLLHKIQRSELAATQLLSIYIDCQGVGDKSAHSFLTTVSHAMANALGIQQTRLSQEALILISNTF